MTDADLEELARKYGWNSDIWYGGGDDQLAATHPGLHQAVHDLLDELERAREALREIAKAPCITALLGDDGEYGCGCPSCRAKLALMSDVTPRNAALGTPEQAAAVGEEDE